MQPTNANFERFSDDIRHSMRIANREAKRHLQSHIDTPHLLIALLKERTGLAGAVLRQKGLTTRTTRGLVRRTISRQWFVNVTAKLPLTFQVKSVIQHAIDHAIKEKHDSVGTGGIMLAMVRHDQMTADVLQSLSVSRESLERDLAKYVHRFMVEAPGQVLQLDVVGERPAA